MENWDGETEGFDAFGAERAPAATLAEEVELLRLEVYALQQQADFQEWLTTRLPLQADLNRLFGESLLLSVLLLRHIRNSDEAALEAAQAKLKQIVKQAGEWNTQQMLPSDIWRELAEACGKMADTRTLKYLTRPPESE